MELLNQLGEEIIQAMDNLSETESVKIIKNAVEWETDTDKFRYDSKTNTLYIQPKQKIENLDITITILPTGSIFVE